MEVLVSASCASVVKHVGGMHNNHHIGARDSSVPVARGPVVGRAGAVSVIYGSSTGLTSANAQLWTQNSIGIAGEPETDDQFGFALAAGDFGKSPQADLAIGVPYENIGTNSDSGAVHVLYGSPDGLSAVGSQFLYQGSQGIWNTPSDYERFGYALAAGNFGRGPQSDLAIGVPGESSTLWRSGAVHVFYGSADGLTTANEQFLTLDSIGGDIAPAQDDAFGSSLAAADFNGSGSPDDLAIGVPKRTVSGIIHAGIVQILYGSAANGLSTPGHYFSQNSSNIVGVADYEDRFGGSLHQSR